MTVKKLFELEPGDRFFFTGDPKKEVREIFQVVHKGRYVGKPKVGYVIYTDLKEGHSDREVVFLRNTKNKM